MASAGCDIGGSNRGNHFEKSKFKRIGNKFSTANAANNRARSSNTETNYVILDQNENTSSSSSTDSLSNVQHGFVDEQTTNKDSNSSMNDSTDNKSSTLNENKSTIRFRNNQ
jgi:hypothetical protein